MKLEDLAPGEIYRCKLSKREVLVCEVPREEPREKPEDKPKFKTVKVGKSFVTKGSGDTGFAHDELFDGQLEKIND